MWSAAPHPVDHNDAWIRLGPGVDLLKANKGVWRKGGSRWFKAYQNRGAGKLAKYVLSVDFNGHQLVSRWLTAGRPYSVCISGRSSRFRVYAIALVRCTGVKDCPRWSGTIRSEMASLKPAKCEQ